MTDDIDGLFANLRRSPFGDWTRGEVVGQEYNIPTDPAGVAQDIYLTPETQAYIYAGLANANFISPPPDISSDINNTDNKLPGWTFTQASGTTVTARLQTDSGSGSGYCLRLSLASGAAGDDGYIEQIIPVRSSSTRQMAIGTVASKDAQTFTVSGNSRWYVDLQYLKADASTTTGSADLSTRTLTSASTDCLNLPGAQAPADAAFLRVRIGLKRDTAGNTATATVDITEIVAVIATPFVVVPEITTPATYGPATVQSVARRVWANYQDSPAMAYQLAPATVSFSCADVSLPGSGTQGIYPVSANNQGTPANINQPMPFAGSVIGLAVRLNTACTGGTWTFQVYNNSTSTAIGPTVTITNGEQMEAATGSPYASGSQFGAAEALRVLCTASGSPTPTTADVICTVVCTQTI